VLSASGMRRSTLLELSGMEFMIGMRNPLS